LLVYSPSALSDTEIERQVRIEACRTNLALFAVTYLTDDEGKPFEFEDFHVEWCDLCISKEERVLMLGPATFGKTTIVAKAYPIHTVCYTPNARMKLGSKTSDDAEARLDQIKTELESNAKLIEDFGEFRSDHWRTKEINVRQRTLHDKEPTILAFGAESSISGVRATHLVLDDIVTEKNSGVHVEDQTRRKMATDFFMYFRKMNYPKRRLYIRWINTVVHGLDLVHECAGINGQMPDDSRATWRSTKNFYVWRRAAYDEEKQTTLWPAAYTVADAEREKAEDVISFQKRMQNRVLDPSMLPFQRSWFDGDDHLVPPAPGCIDRFRVQDALPPSKDNAIWVRGAGYDPNPGLSETSGWCAYAEIAIDRMSERPWTYYITYLARFRKTFPEQIKFLVERTRARRPDLTFIERNVQQQWFMQVPEITGLSAEGLRVEGHYTSASNKPDPATGVPNFAGMTRAGKLRFPSGDAHSREMSEVAIAEFLAYPQGATSDVVMAIWFAKLACDKALVQSGLRVYGGGLPRWADNQPSMETLDRIFPTMKPN
jgi:hypothetical protein